MSNIDWLNNQNHTKIKRLKAKFQRIVERIKMKMMKSFPMDMPKWND